MIIDSVEQLSTLANRVLFLYPVVGDTRLHKHHNKIIAFVFIDVQTKQTFTITNGHPEGIFHTSDLSFLNNNTVYCYDSFILKYNGYDTSKFIDTRIQYYLQTGQGYNLDTPSIVNHYTRLYPKCFKTNELISISKHEQLAMELFTSTFIKEEQPGLSFYQDKVFNVFYNIEKNGLKVDSKEFTQRFGQTTSKHENYCYTEYNYFTTTGRPSNRFGGINFAALNKDDNTRDVFVSRYDNGVLVEMDFNSYHPRLIASLIGYDFGSENVYEHLAKYYTNSDNPSSEDIEKAKENTFRQLYGGINKQYMHIPFFAATHELAQAIWKEASTHGFVQSPLSNRKLVVSNYQDLTEYTLFNYFIQMYETECNVIILENMLKLLENRNIKPILYTYDSILFDVDLQELEHLKEFIIPKSIDLHKFPVKIKQGSTYKKITV